MVYYYGMTDDENMTVEVWKTLFCEDDEIFSTYEKCAEHYRKLGYEVV